MMLFMGGFFSLSAQGYNLFDAEDVDADGWIWFDTQAKIDKYVGEGKLIELYDATHTAYREDSLKTEGFAELKGVGTNGEYEGTDYKTGAIRLACSSKNGTADGGSFEINSGPCVSFNLFLSADGQMRPILSGFNNGALSDWVTIKSYPFTSLSNAGQKTWANMENHETTSGFSLKHEDLTYMSIQNTRNTFLLIHGMKIMTSSSSSIDQVSVGIPYSFDGRKLTLEEQAAIYVYSSTGTVLANEVTSSFDFSSYSKGIYIVKINGKGIKLAVK